MMNSNLKKPQRNSALELLRIISLLMIVFHHFAIHGKFGYSYSTVTVPRLWYYFIVMGGKIGVDIFVLISGYFLIDDKSQIVSFRRTTKLWGQAAFYCVLIPIIFALMGKTEITTISIIKSFFPVTFGSWWFLSAYFVLYLLHPFINRLLHTLSKRQFQSLLLLMIFMWCIIPTFTLSEYEGSNVMWFVVLYCLAAYIKIYGLNPKFTKAHYTVFFFIFGLLTYLTSFVSAFLSTKWAVFGRYATFFHGQEKLPALLTAVSLFMAFAQMKMSYHKWINTIASATFGVYLIHDSSVVRTFLWRDFIISNRFQYSLKTIPYSIAVVLAVFIGCTVIDLARQHTAEKLFMKLIDKIDDKITKLFEKPVSFSKRIAFGEE